MQLQGDTTTGERGDDPVSPLPIPPAAVLDPSTVRWQRSYDRASVDRFVAEVEAQRGRLRAEIAAAQAAAHAAAARTGEARTSDDLVSLVVDAQRQLDTMEREHQEMVSAIQATAEEEAERILTAARAEAEAVRSSAEAISQLVDGIGEPGALPERSSELPVVERSGDDGPAVRSDVG